MKRMRKERKIMNNKFKNMQSFALIPVLVIAGILAIHMMAAISIIAPAIPMA
jgi:hypothetical protein